jgi:3-hydroxyisobutyrate dehydrogenase-like beta-hydroxyacid dehydrogenase
MRIAFLGLGAMGARMAARLIAAGHRLTVFNRTPGRDAALVAAGAVRAATPREAVGEAEMTIAMLTDDMASRSVWTDSETGALAGLAPSALAIESSTVTPGWVRELDRLARARGAAFLDAPVLGSRPQADAGRLIHLVGGAPADFARAQPVLASLGAAAHLVGPAGAGATLKLAVNTQFGVQVVVLAEMLALLERSGIDRAAAMGVLGGLPVVSAAAAGAGALIVAGDDTPQFPVDLVEKDFGYALAVAAGFGLRPPVAAAARAVFVEARAAGLGGANLTSVWRIFADARGCG